MGRITRIFRREQDDCVGVRKLSSRYMEGDLPQPRLQSIKAHLDGCAPCRAFISGLEHTVSLLSRLPRHQPPRSLKESILEKARERSGQRGPSHPEG